MFPNYEEFYAIVIPHNIGNNNDDISDFEKIISDVSTLIFDSSENKIN